MSLTRKSLAAMEIPSEKIDEIISMHLDTVNGLKEEIDKYKTEAEKLPEVQKELEELKKNADTTETFKEKYDQIIAEHKKLQKEYDTYREETENKEVRSKKESAFKSILGDAGIPEHHHAKIIKYSDIDGLELDDKGKITTAKDILKSIKEEWSDHIQTETVQGAETATPPSSSTGGSIRSARDYERQYHQNLYGKAKED